MWVLFLGSISDSEEKSVGNIFYCQRETHFPGVRVEEDKRVWVCLNFGKVKEIVQFYGR